LISAFGSVRLPTILQRIQEFTAKFPTVEKQGNFSGKQGISAPGRPDEQAKGPLIRVALLTARFEVRNRTPMVAYKRNQVEEAIARAFLSAPNPPLDLRTKLKRLLDADRNLGRNTRAKDPLRSTFAFYSQDPPGSGFEVQFSAYEAFALMTAWRFLEHGWPQQSVVHILRQVRQQLEEEHARILKLDPSALFDEEAIRRNARAGDLYTGSTEESFLVVTSRQGTSRGDATWSRSARVCQGQGELMAYIRGGGAGETWTSFGLTRAAFDLKFELDKTAPSKRGRGGP
jgi:hypothetical protein